MSKSFYYIIINSGLQRIAYDLVGIFGVLYLYVLFDNSVELSIGILSLMYILVPFFAYMFLPVIERLGMKKSMMISSLISVLSVIPMFFFNTKIWIFFGLWVSLASIAKVFYYIPYHYYNARLTDGHHRGKEFSKLNSVILFLSIITPIIGGVTTQVWGVAGVAVMAMIFSLLAMIPLIKVENFTFHLSKNIIDLLVHTDVQKTLKILAIEQFQAKEIFWQCFIFISVGASFSNFGLLISAITLLTIPLLLYFGKFSDHHNKKWLIKIQGLFTSVLWFARLFINTIYQVVFIDIIHKVNYNTRTQTMGIVLYDLATKDKQELLLDEKIIIRETFDNMVLGLGLLSGVVIYYFFGFVGVFAFAGVVSLLFARL